MKRIAAFLLVSSLGVVGCTTTQAGKTASGPKTFNSASKPKTVPGVVGGNGEPVVAMKNASGVVQTSATTTVTDPAVQQTAGFTRIIGKGHSDCDSGCGGGVKVPGVFNRGGGGCDTGNCGGGHGGGYGRGVVPAPAMGPWGAVALIPGAAIGPGMGFGQASNMRTSIKFIGNGKVTWFAGGSYAEPGLTMPADYNFAQASIYRLKVAGIPSKPGKTYYPTLEVYAATPKSLTFLDHGTVPVSFTDEDLARVDNGNLVIKVIYLPDSLYQDVTAIGGAEEIVSTQLEPGADPIAEANRRGTILAVIRLGNINLENPNSPAKDAPVGGGAPSMTPAPGPGSAMTPMPMPGTMTPAPLPAITATPTSLKK